MIILTNAFLAVCPASRTRPHSLRDCTLGLLMTGARRQRLASFSARSRKGQFVVSRDNTVEDLVPTQSDEADSHASA